MHWKRRLLAIMLGIVVTLGTAGVTATDDLPRTFGECVLQGGDVRRIDGELTCRLIRSYDFRVYGTGTNECGDLVDIEIWGETRTGVVTYFLALGRTVELPEIGGESMALPEDPSACLEG